jgi:thiol-disulfide isomerase/thioredoxin
MTDATHDSLSDDPKRGGWRWGSLVLLAAIILGYIVVVTAPKREMTGTQGPAIGKSLPYLRLEPLTGDARLVTVDDLQGRVTLLNFWGTWCAPCIREFPHLVELSERFKDRPEFQFLPVSCGSEGNDTDLEPLTRATDDFLKARMLELPTYADRGAGTRQAIVMLIGGNNQFGLPITLLIDRQGRVRAFWMGYSPKFVEEMRIAAEELLDAPAANESAS